MKKDKDKELNEKVKSIMGINDNQISKINTVDNEFEKKVSWATRLKQSPVKIEYTKEIEQKSIINLTWSEKIKLKRQKDKNEKIKRTDIE